MIICLASRSPRRRQLLEQIGIKYELVDIEVDESWDGNETARDYVGRVALEKATAGRRARQDAVVLAADTAVVLDHYILGKAESAEQARVMLQQLSGRTHEVYTAIAVAGDTYHEAVNVSRVSFRPLTSADIDAYIASGEPLGKAGGYAIQGLAAAFISHLDGSYSGVMGLPLYETTRLLQMVTEGKGE